MEYTIFLSKGRKKSLLQLQKTYLDFKSDTLKMILEWTM